MDSHHHCDCNHEHCRKLEKTPKATTYPLTMENVEKGVKNINTIIDMIDTRQDDNREQMIIFLKIFCDDLLSRLTDNDYIKNNKDIKEPEMPVMERINKTLIQLLQLKPTVIAKYGSELLDKIWKLEDEMNDYIAPLEILEQPKDARLTPIELMKYFLKVLFGNKDNVDKLLNEGYIIIDGEKRQVCINEEKCKEIGKDKDKYINENNLLHNLMIIKIMTYIKPEVFYTSVSSFLTGVDNSIIKFYKILSLFSFTLWTLSNKKDSLVKSLIYIIGGVLKDFCRSLFKTENIDINKLIYFKEKEKEEHFFKPIILPEKSVLLIKKFLLLNMTNFIAVFLSGYDADKSFDIQDGNYWDDYYGLILRLKDPKLTEAEQNEIPRMIPLSLDMKSVVILFITDFIFFFCTHFCEVGDNGIKTDFNNFDNLKFLGEYMIINSNYNILTFFQKNVEHVRFNALQSEKMEYDMKDNFNTYGLFFIYFSLLNEKKVPLIINKKAYVDTMNEYIKVVLKEAKDFGIPEKSNALMKYFIDELKKNKFISLNENELKI
jgi:hypothetical protein